MNRILLTGAALLTLINAGMPTSAAPKHARQYQEVPQQRSFGSGARVDEVDPNSPAARAGMRPGDRIVGINGTPIDGISDVIPFVAGGGRPITVDIERGGDSCAGHGLSPERSMATWGARHHWHVLPVLSWRQLLRVLRAAAAADH